MALRNPGNLPQGNGANSIRLQRQGLGDVVGRFYRPPTTDPGGGFFTYAARVSSLQGMPAPTYPLDARYVCERCFGPLEVAYASASGRRPRGAQAPDPGRAALAVALRRLPAGADAAAGDAARRLDAAAAGRPARRASSASSELWIKNDAANPTHSFKDRVVSVALARARELGFTTIACASTGNLANAVAAHAAAAGLESYVFIPSDLEEQKVLATGDLRDATWSPSAATTTTSTGSAPSSPASTSGRS